jgi:uncharacterized protein involved in exopolysaccharide biosynthesis
MQDSFDADQYVRYLGRKWRTVAIACGVACGLAAGISLRLTKKYTATCRMLIEPPGASDQRTAQAVSPIYLESLKTYEHFAASDSLFLNAVERFRLRSQIRSLEDWKRRVLKVGLVQNTKILELRVTLPDPRIAQALAFYLAGEAVKLNRKLNREGDQEFAAEAEKLADQARARMEQAESAKRRMLTEEPIEAVVDQIKSVEELKGTVSRDLLAAEMMIAEDLEREKDLARTGERRGELDTVRSELRLTRPRVDDLHKRSQELEREIARLQTLRAGRAARLETLLAERRDAQANLDALESRLRDIKGTLGFRGERLTIIDPGIVPDKPSSPNLPLNVLVALVAALLGSIAYLSAQFSRRRQPLSMEAGTSR